MMCQSGSPRCATAATSPESHAFLPWQRCEQMHAGPSRLCCARSWVPAGRCSPAAVTASKAAAVWGAARESEGGPGVAASRQRVEAAVWGGG